MPLENCPLCRGTGWKLVARAAAESGSVALPCDCGMEERSALAVDRARIPKRYEGCEFANYETELTDGKNYTPRHGASLKQAKLVAQGFVRDYPGNDQAGLLLEGPPGVGKTHLAIAALKELMKRGHSGYFCEYGKLLKEIQNTYNANSEVTEIKILDPILSVEVLVIDDLGCIKPSDWVRDTIGYILNSRYVEASRDISHPRCTIITTNYMDAVEEREGRLPNGKLIMNRADTLGDRIGERMRSRLYEMCRTVEISAPDFRRVVSHAGSSRGA